MMNEPNPYKPPQDAHDPVKASCDPPAMPWGPSAKKSLALVTPWAIPVLVGMAYTWVNIDKRLLVERFGCGCPRLDGTYGFNTNDISMILFLAVFISCSGVCLFLSKRLVERKRVAYLIASTIIISVICARFFLVNVWL